ncbi:MAG: site-specific DNA-methyltransferase [Firmicutes bacterium]|nr:site-specific DNA-methyltransferase [Bacillota bacterium]
MKKKSPKNKTIDMGLAEGMEYLQRCILVDADVSLEEICNSTICGDLFEIAPHLPRECADLLIVDPPYNLYKDYHGNHFSKTNLEKYEVYTRSWLDLVLPLLKETGSMYVCCDWESSLVIGRVLMEKTHVRNRITWQREKGRGAKANWKNAMEDIWYVTKGEEYTFNLDAVKQRKRVLAPYKEDGMAKDWTQTADGKYRDTCPSNFWDDITVPFWSMSENTAHPTQKPEKLIAKLVLASSQRGDVVLDPFLGSGTTSVVCKKLGRSYIGIEQNELYCAWAEKRLEMAEKDPVIQGYEKGVFWERNMCLEQRK